MTANATIFEVQPSDIGLLSDEDLECLVVRLCEAEAPRNHNGDIEIVGGGDMRAADGGIDVRISIHCGEFHSMFLPTRNVGFQVKRQKMGPAKVIKEMQNDKKLKSDIFDLLSSGGSYIIFCSQDNCGSKMLNNRTEAMIRATGLQRDIVEGHVFFYDQSKICRWVNCHIAANLWVRDRLNKTFYGWRAYGGWSSRVKDLECGYLTSEGISVDIFCDKNMLELDAISAIDECRKLFELSNNAIRVVGHPGIGKTRFVEALFDRDVGISPLNHMHVIYRNVAFGSDLGIDEVLCHLAQYDRMHIMVLDNCSPKLHRQTLDCIGANRNVKLISIDFDVGDDSPSGTLLVRISLRSTEIAKDILLHQHPSLGYANASRIAKFSDGNPRLARFFAERVESGERIAHISDRELFERLFFQRNIKERQVQIGTEILSLVHSFDFSSNESECIELRMLAGLNRNDEDDLYRTASELNKRGLIRMRGNQRVVTPQALALKLARLAFENIRLERIREVMQDDRDSRLLRSFSRRLGMLHDLEQVSSLVNIWMNEDGLLGGRDEIDKNWATLLRNVAPVAEQDTLLLLEEKLNQNGLSACAACDQLCHQVKELLFELAYDGTMFTRCVTLLINLKFASNGHYFESYVDQVIEQLYQPFMSGTHASAEVRASMMRETLMSSDIEKREIGDKMWMSAMIGKTWSISYTRDFGVKYRDFGSHPTSGQFRKWRKCFLDTLINICMCDCEEAAKNAKRILTTSLFWLWEDESLRNTLVRASTMIRSRGLWLEGWIAAKALERHQIRMAERKERTFIPDQLLGNLMKIVSPVTLVQQIIVVLRERIEHSIDEAGRNAFRLGEEAVKSKNALRELSSELYSTENNGLEEWFGKGLAKGTNCTSETWNELINLYKLTLDTHNEFGVLVGYLSEVMNDSWEEAQKILDTCMRDEKMRTNIIRLHPFTKIHKEDVVRCTIVLDNYKAKVSGGSVMLGKAITSNFDDDILLGFIKALARSENGEVELVLGISRLGSIDADWSSEAMQEVGRIVLSAAGNVIQNNAHKYDEDVFGYSIESVARFAHKTLADKTHLVNFVDSIMKAAEKLGGDYIVHSHASLVDFFAEFETELLLEKIFESTNQDLSKERYELLSRCSLQYAQAERVAQWCVEAGKDCVWRVIGEGIEPFEKDKRSESGKYKFTEFARKLLDMCCYPAELLVGYTRCTLRAGLITEKRELIGEILRLYGDLTTSSNHAIANGATIALNKCRGELMKIDDVFDRSTTEYDGFDF